MESILRKQRDYFLSGATLPIEARRDALKKLHEAIKTHVDELQEALKEDLGKSATESYMCEIGLSLSDITYTLHHLKGWVRPERHLTALQNFPARSRVLKEPYGVALIMSLWNYPFLLLISPLVGALAAGNCCVLKPSELVTRILVPDVHTQEDGRSTCHVARPIVALSAIQGMEGQIHQEIFEVVSRICIA